MSLDALRAKKARLDALRPLAGESLAALARWYDAELTFTSNAIEGNTLTRGETALILDKGLTIGGKTLREHLEIVDHAEALGFVRALALESRPLREIDVRDIHRLVMARSNPSVAGAYATSQRFILGSDARFPPPAALPAAMAAFGAWLTAAPPSPEAAFDAHWRLVAIHPFADGNGRTARLLMNLLLFRDGWPPVVIAPDQRLAYLDALETRQRGDAAPHDAFLTARLHEGLDRFLEAAALHHPKET